MMWPSHHHLDKYTKDLIKMLRENNVGITKLYSILGTFFGKMANVPTTKRSLKYLCQQINGEQAENDMQKTLQKFSELMKDDPGFKYIYQPDEDGRMKTLMWTSSRSRVQYQYFGDAITFDTTYKTNLYDMPFGLIVGVNNHFQSILLARVLMTDETIETFQWVFREFAKLMGGKAPATILTDQCRAMEVAIALEWEAVVHRWCKWHVLKRIVECVGQTYTSDKDFRDKFHKMLNEMLTIEEFEAQWKALLKEYGLQENPFLNQIFHTREKWAKCYFKGIFCARMTSTQRSESANMMLKNIVPPGCTLHKFVEQYDMMQYIRVEEENYQEKRSKSVSKKSTRSGPLVVHASKLYTANVLSLFCELKDKSEYFHAYRNEMNNSYTVENYELELVQRWSKGRYIVDVTHDGTIYSCECGLFEHFGLPCQHIIRVLICRGEQKIPESLIMKRWTKKAMVQLPGHFGVYSLQDASLRSQSYRHPSLMISVLEYVEMADKNAEAYKVGLQFLAEGKKAMAVHAAQPDGLGLADRVEVEEPSDATDNFPLRTPVNRRDSGRPTNKRLKPAYEGGAKRPRYCSVCRSDKHNKTKCPDKTVEVMQTRKPPTCSGCGLEGHTIDKCTVEPARLLELQDFLF
ncbi:unnamed protein product [Urochloa humidicola]